MKEEYKEGDILEVKFEKREFVAFRFWTIKCIFEEDGVKRYKLESLPKEEEIRRIKQEILEFLDEFDFPSGIRIKVEIFKEDIVMAEDELKEFFVLYKWATNNKRKIVEIEKEFK